MKLSPAHRRWLHGTSAMLFLSGAAWLLVPRSLGSWMLRAHGAAAMVFLVVFGMLLPTHIRASLTARKNLRSGYALIALIAALALSGYLLYYAGHELARSVVSWLHTGLGLASPAVLWWHLRYREVRVQRSPQPTRDPSTTPTLDWELASANRE